MKGAGSRIAGLIVAASWLALAAFAPARAERTTVVHGIPINDESPLPVVLTSCSANFRAAAAGSPATIVTSLAVYNRRTAAMHAVTFGYGFFRYDRAANRERAVGLEHVVTIADLRGYELRRVVVRETARSFPATRDAVDGLACGLRTVSPSAGHVFEYPPEAPVATGDRL